MCRDTSAAVFHIPETGETVPSSIRGALVTWQEAGGVGRED